MSSEMNAKDDPIANMHLFYLGGLLVEGLKNLHNDILINCRFAPDLLSRAPYVRVMELREKFEQAALLEAR